MFSKTVMMGRICNDLELKTTPNGVPVLSFRIAVDRRYQPNKEERKSDFFTVIAWRNTAEFVSKYFSKGRMILVEGELQTRDFTDNNGTKRYVTELVANSVSFTGEKSDNATPKEYAGNERYDNQNSAVQKQNQQEENNYTAQEFPTAPPSDDDGYPF